ncbi:MAG: transporter [Halieaceae bacterium]
MNRFLVPFVVSVPLLCNLSYAAKGDGIIDPGENETEELARAVQNPIASLISLPFQTNTDFNYGPQDKTQSVTNIQPVWPVELNEDWNLITRTIVPVVTQPELIPGQGRETGLGDTTFTAFFSPADSGAWIWGVGPAALIPTNTDDRLGPDEWGIGPSFVVLTMPGRWVIGSLFSNVWDINGDEDLNFFTWQPFVNYNMDKGWYLTSSPIVTANWEGESGEKWTIPVGGGIGRIFRVGSQAMNANFQYFYNLEKPEEPIETTSDWTVRLQIQFMFPKSK